MKSRGFGSLLQSVDTAISSGESKLAQGAGSLVSGELSSLFGTSQPAQASTAPAIPQPGISQGPSMIEYALLGLGGVLALIIVIKVIR